MDLYCPKCSEPWDNDCLHDEAQAREQLKKPNATYYAVWEEFKTKGCEALELEFGGEHGDGEPSPVVAEIYSVVGGDTDFAMSMISDAETMGML